MSFVTIDLKADQELAVARREGFHQLLLRASIREGDRLLLLRGEQALYFCGAPGDVKAVFAQGYRRHRGPLQELVGIGLFASATSEAHERTRRTISAIYTASQLEAFAYQVQSVARRLIGRRLAKDTQVLCVTALFEYCTELSVAINAALMFGDHAPDRVTTAVSTVITCMTTALFGDDSDFEKHRSSESLRAAKETIRDHTHSLIAASGDEEVAGVAPLVIDLARALRVAGADDAALDAEVLSLLGSGLETAGATAFWSLYELARHPSEQDLLRRWIAEEDMSPVSEWALSRATPVARVVYEALRLYPSGWAMFRDSVDGITLSDGTVLPPGSRVCVSPFVTHRTYAGWHNSLQFQPSRFQDAAQTSDAIGKYQFFPFAGGGHRCIGERLAIMQVSIVLFEMLRQRWFGFEGDAPLGTAARLCLEPVGEGEFTVGSLPTSRTEDA